MNFIGTLIRRLFLPTLLIISITFNGMLLLSTTFFNLASTTISVASSAVGFATGQARPKIRTTGDVARLTADIDEEKRINRELRSQVAEVNADLVRERQIKRELRSEVAEIGQELATSRAARNELRSTMGDVAQRVTARATKTATRETASMPGEAIPFWGTAVIVAATTLEIYDLCQTVIDMNEMQAAIDPDLAVAPEELTVCSMSIPTRGEIWDAVSSAPSTAWNSARGAMPTLEDIQSFELPSMDWQSLSDGVVATTSSIAESVGNAATTKWDQLKNWYDN
tara:strand:+ start:488 stop:1336 length:849 start_codon:yes stop_codon:yes gene_type:complete